MLLQKLFPTDFCNLLHNLRLPFQKQIYKHHFVWTSYIYFPHFFNRINMDRENYKAFWKSFSYMKSLMPWYLHIPKKENVIYCDVIYLAVLHYRRWWLLWIINRAFCSHQQLAMIISSIFINLHTLHFIDKLFGHELVKICHSFLLIN